MASLKDWDIIKLNTLITNVDAKLSASTKTDRDYQILCLVRRNDQILLRYIDGKGEVHLMLLCWFAENQKCIQDICFDNSEAWLLVFCKYALSRIIFYYYLIGRPHRRNIFVSHYAYFRLG